MNLFYKRILFAGAMACMFLPWAAAQNGDSQQSDRPAWARQPQHQQRRLALLAQKLNLTDEQKQQWMQIQRETAQKVRAARKDDSLSEEQMQARLKEIHAQQKGQVLALLSPEQQQLLKDFWEEQRQKQQTDKNPDNSPAYDSSAQTSSTQALSAQASSAQASSAQASSAQASSAQASSAQTRENEKEDDLFAGMVSDDPVPAPQLPRNKKAK